MPGNKSGTQDFHEIWNTRTTHRTLALENPRGQKVLNLYHQALHDLPPSVWEAVQLEVLNVGNNELSALPEALGNLKNLRMLDLGHNHFTGIPKSIGKLVKLHFLFK